MGLIVKSSLLTIVCLWNLKFGLRENITEIVHFKFCRYGEMWGDKFWVQNWRKSGRNVNYWRQIFDQPLVHSFKNSFICLIWVSSLHFSYQFRSLSPIFALPAFWIEIFLTKFIYFLILSQISTLNPLKKILFSKR